MYTRYSNTIVHFYCCLDYIRHKPFHTSYEWLLVFTEKRYSALTENQKLTCDGKVIKGFEDHDKAQCENECDERKECRYFFVTSGGEWCFLYSSCVDKRVTGYFGSTYYKIGIILYKMIFYLSNILKLNHGLLIFFS